MNKKDFAIVVLLLLSLFLFGCGKEKPEPTTDPPAPPADMIFEPVSQTVTAKEETNLRNYPGQGEESTVLFTLKNGEYAERIGISDSGWSKLDYENTTCYAVSSFLTTDLNYSPSALPENEDGIQTAFTPASGTVTAKDAVNLRSLPSVTNADAEIIAQLKNGDTAGVLGVSDNGWTKLDYNGTVCYAVSSYLTNDLNYTPSAATPAYMEEDGIHTVFTDADGSVTAKDMVNLRSLPSVTNPEAVIITQLHKGEIAQRLGISESGWTKLQYDGKTCYAVSSYLTTNLDGSEEDDDPDGDGIRTQFREVHERVTAKDAVNLRAKPSTTDPDAVVVKKLLNGEVVIRTGINDDLGWSRVEYEGQVLYCISNYLTISNLQ